MQTNPPSIDDLLREQFLGMDVEFGNSHAFFSGKLLQPRCYPSPSLPLLAAYAATLPGAHLGVEDSVGTDVTGLLRTVQFTALQPSKLFDLVSRFVVRDTSAQDRAAIINGTEVAHLNSNLYHQYPAGNVRVPCGTSHWLQFDGQVQGDLPAGFEHVFYVRDSATTPSGKQWIVHHRIVATEAAEDLVVRCCNPRFEGPLPRKLNALVPRAIKRGLFRIREQRYPNFPFMAVGENTLPRGAHVALHTRVRIHE